MDEQTEKLAQEIYDKVIEYCDSRNDGRKVSRVVVDSFPGSSPIDGVLGYTGYRVKVSTAELGSRGKFLLEESAIIAG